MLYYCINRSEVLSTCAHTTPGAPTGNEGTFGAFDFDTRKQLTNNRRAAMPESCFCGGLGKPTACNFDKWFKSPAAISRRRQSFSVSRRRRWPPGNLHRPSRRRRTSTTLPRFTAISFTDLARFNPTSRSLGHLGVPVNFRFGKLAQRSIGILFFL